MDFRHFYIRFVNNIGRASRIESDAENNRSEVSRRFSSAFFERAGKRASERADERQRRALKRAQVAGEGEPGE